MFVGEYAHSLDDKGRIILPAKFRDQLEGGGFMMKVHGGCLAVYTAEEFEKVSTAMEEKARRGARERNVVRSLAAGTTEVDPDRQGRLAIPSKLREFAALERDVTINGAVNRIEIWDRNRWEDLNQEAETQIASGDAGLDDLGI